LSNKLYNVTALLGLCTQHTSKHAFTAADIIYLKERAQIGDFGSSVTNTYLSLTNSTAEDTSGNPVIAIPPVDMPYPAVFVVPDTRGPIVVAFTLDMNNGNFTLHFDELVNISTFNSLIITLRGNNSELSPSYTITSSGTPVLFNSGTNIMIQLTNDDLNGIKGQQICNTTADCYVTFFNKISV